MFVSFFFFFGLLTGFKFMCVNRIFNIRNIFFSKKKNQYFSRIICMSKKSSSSLVEQRHIINARCGVWRHYKLNRYLTRANIFREHFICLFFFRLQNSHILNVCARVLAFKFRLREMQRGGGGAASAAATHKYLWSNEQKPIAFIYRNFLKIVYMGSRAPPPYTHTHSSFSFW